MLVFRLLSFLSGYIGSIILAIVTLAYLAVFETTHYLMLLKWASYIVAHAQTVGPEWVQAGTATVLNNLGVAILMLVLIFRVAFIVFFHFLGRLIRRNRV